MSHPKLNLAETGTKSNAEVRCFFPDSSTASSLISPNQNINMHFLVSARLSLVDQQPSFTSRTLLIFRI